MACIVRFASHTPGSGSFRSTSTPDFDHALDLALCDYSSGLPTSGDWKFGVLSVRHKFSF